MMILFNLHMLRGDMGGLRVGLHSTFLALMAP
jgi:hypothetical protein